MQDSSWQIMKRYSDFEKLHSQLKISNIDLPLPPKKTFGNFDREFIAERQKGLQVVRSILSQMDGCMVFMQCKYGY